MSEFGLKAQAAWGEQLPDWVAVLAEAADQMGGLQAVAGMIGYSKTAVSLVINSKWKSDLSAVEQAVRGALMDGTVSCPVIGEMALDVCLGHQKAPLMSHSPQRILFARACLGCGQARQAPNGKAP